MATCKTLEGEREEQRTQAASLQQRLGDTDAKLTTATAEIAKLQADTQTKQVSFNPKTHNRHAIMLWDVCMQVNLDHFGKMQ